MSDPIVSAEEAAAAPSSPISPASNYLDNYRTLSEAAKELREQDIVDIDRLVPLVDRALAAFSACKGRIEAVERMLLEKLGEDEAEPTSVGE